MVLFLKAETSIKRIDAKQKELHDALDVGGIAHVYRMYGMAKDNRGTRTSAFTCSNHVLRWHTMILLVISQINTMHLMQNSIYRM